MSDDTYQGLLVAGILVTMLLLVLEGVPNDRED